MMGIFILTVLGLFFGILLTFISHKFNSGDNVKKKILEHLPGYNCGACGFGSCEGMAEAMKENPMNYQKCKPMRGEIKKRMEEYLKENGMIEK